jgi:hypothetical protein|tara:strand:- start:351 stop:863 length:513 start_codon:yes stop_codon:yes gene_type:complete
MRWIGAFILGNLLWYGITFVAGIVLANIGYEYRSSWSNFHNFIFYPLGVWLGFKITKTSFFGSNWPALLEWFYVRTVPYPNVIAGVLVGIGNTSWTTVAGASAIWGFIWVVWSIVRGSPWILGFVHKAVMDKGWSLTRAWAAALFIEYFTAVSTALPIGCIAFAIKGWIT